jgi:hypothetical protein
MARQSVGCGRGGGRGCGRGRGRGRGRGPPRSGPHRNPMLQNDLNAPSQVRRYHNILLEFMEHKNNTKYHELDKTFTVEELVTITPEHIYRWMCKRVYDKEDPSADDNPTNCRSSSLQYWKKAIAVMPLQQMKARWEHTK